MRKQNKNLKADFNTSRTDMLRDKLLREISDYERQLAELKLNGSQVNFTMIQTYKELISARQAMLRRLPAEGIADKELSALLRRERLVPVVHGTTYEELEQVSLLLASRAGLSTAEESMAEVAAKIAELVAI